MKTPISTIINELNLDNGSNYKMDVLRKHKDNKTLQRVLKMTYDKVTYVYSITMKNINTDKYIGTTTIMSLDQALNVIESELSTRAVTGNGAITLLENVFASVIPEDAAVIKGVINRDQRINMGRTNILKVFPKLFVKQPYNRCGIAGEKELKTIKWSEGIYSNLKLDGTYRSFNDGKFTSRSGKTQDFPLLEEVLKTVPSDYVLIGEMTLKGETNRAKGNGLINSLDIPEEEILYTIWDAVHIDEYKLKNGKTPYNKRFEKTKEIINLINNTQIEIVPNRMVFSLKEAYEHFQEVTAKGLEGTVIKTQKNPWKDGTSKEALKMKLEISAEMRVKGFIEGKPGTKRTKTFGSLMFGNDEGTVKGSTSGFTDKMLTEINNNREEWIGKVIEVEFNDITKGRDNDYWALSHPRFLGERTDKTDTDTLERIKEMKEMAMNLESK